MAAEEKAFDLSKELLTSSRLLVHFDPSLPLILTCDASDYGVGAMLGCRMGKSVPLDTPQYHFQRQNEITPSWKKRLLPAYSVSKDFTHIYLDITFT